MAKCHTFLSQKTGYDLKKIHHFETVPNLSIFVSKLLMTKKTEIVIPFVLCLNSPFSS